MQEKKTERIQAIHLISIYWWVNLRTLKNLNVREGGIEIYSHEWLKARSFQADATEDYNSQREEDSWEFSRKCALRDIHRFDPSVRLYVYVFLESVLSASCNTGGNKARKRFSVASWRCFNAMKTVSALQHEEKRTCLFQHVHFLVRTSRLAPKKFQQWN